MSTSTNTLEHPTTDSSRDAKTASAFRRALTRKQRAEFLSEVESVLSHHNTPGYTDRPFDGDVPLEQRLLTEGLNVQAALAAIQVATDQLPQTAEDKLGWADTLLNDNHSPEQSVSPKLEAFHPFLALLQPEADRICQFVASRTATLAEGHCNLPFGTQAGPAIATNMFAGRVLPMIMRTLALELNVARMQGSLTGESPEARFQHFTQLLKTSEFRKQFFQEYVVLAQQIHQVAEQCQVANS